MPETPPPRKVIRFGDFELDLRAGCLTRQGAEIRLRGQVFSVLSMLVERAGDVVTRDELQKRLWPGDVVVDFEISLNTIIARLRELLGDSAEHPRYIATLPKRGYRFIATALESEVFRPALEHRTRLVVLPFINAGGDPAGECFSDAMTDEFISALHQVAPDRLAVIARTTAMHYKHSQKDAAHIGRELGVDFIVEGSVRRAGDRIAINVQLARTSDQIQVLARKYDVNEQDLFRSVERAASEIAEGIGLSIAAEDGSGSPTASGRPRPKPTGDLAAYNEYIQARCQMAKGSAESFSEARGHLETALARDPAFALAHDALAEIDWYLGYFGYVPPRKAFSDGILHALRAVEIDGGRAETHALLGEFHKTLDYNWPEVHREMALALKMDPASPLVRLRYAVSELMPHGRLEEAIEEIGKAIESDPLSLLAQGWLGIMLVLAHRWDSAMEQAHLLLRLYPSDFWGYFVMAVAYREKRDVGRAISALQAAIEASRGLPLLFGWLGLTLGRNGEVAEARALLERLRGEAAKRYVPPTCFAWTHLGLGEFDAAYGWMNRAVDECDQLMMPIKTYAFFDPLRADPRFADLLRKMHLEP